MTWNPVEGMKDGILPDKSQDVKWLRDGFLHRGKQVDDLQNELRGYHKAVMWAIPISLLLGIIAGLVFGILISGDYS